MVDEPDGATPVDPDEAADLIPEHIHTRDELNAWEQANILAAAEWSLRMRRPALDESTIRILHEKMFDRTWAWAGTFRKSDKNIGVLWAHVPTEVRKLVEDGQYWIENGTYGVDEVAARLHHRLVSIHPFPNGNGRHARLWCDLLLRENRRPAFEWKAAELDEEGEARRRYIEALREADGGHFGALFDLLLKGRGEAL